MGEAVYTVWQCAWGGGNRHKKCDEMVVRCDEQEWLSCGPHRCGGNPITPPRSTLSRLHLSCGLALASFQPREVTMRRWILLSVWLVLQGCSSGVMYMGGSEHQLTTLGVSRRFPSTGAQRRALRKANAYCQDKQQVMIVDNMSSQDGIRRTSFPKAELRFRCLSSAEAAAPRSPSP